VPHALGVANVERGPLAPGSVARDLAEPGHGDVDAIKRHFDGIVVGIVAETKEPDAICLDLMVELDRGHDHLNPLGFELFGDTVK
jgi:hypothetical protein